MDPEILNRGTDGINLPTEYTSGNRELHSNT